MLARKREKQWLLMRLEKQTGSIRIQEKAKFAVAPWQRRRNPRSQHMCRCNQPFTHSTYHSPAPDELDSCTTALGNTGHSSHTAADAPAVPAKYRPGSHDEHCVDPLVL